MSILVIKLGGALIDDREVLTTLVGQLKTLHDRGQRFVLVHGGGKAVDAQLGRLGLVSEKKNGLRITPKEHLDQIVGVLAGQMNIVLCAALMKAGIPAVGLSLSDGYMTDARIADPDLGFVGAVTPRDPRLPKGLCESGFVPVISSIAALDGEALNVNADDAAEVIAALVGAGALVLLTDVAGVLDAERQVIPSLTEPDINRLIDAGVIAGGMIAKVRAALNASAKSHAPVLITHWRRADALAEIRQGHAPGTLIVAQ